MKSLFPDDFASSLQQFLDPSSRHKHGEDMRDKIEDVVRPVVENATKEELQERVLKQGDVIVRQHNLLEEFTRPPHGFATVLAVGPEEGATRRVVVITREGKTVGVVAPKDMVLTAGDAVALSIKTGLIAGLVADPQPGVVVTVRHVVNDVVVEVDGHGSIRSVLSGKFSGKLAVGDRVCLDPAMAIVTDHRGKEEMKYSFVGKTGVTWDDIGGLEKAKADMQEIIELPHQYPDLYRFHGKKIPKGALIYGPPGCGKTLLAKAVATSLVTTHGGTGAETAFFNIRGPELLDKYVGEAERKLRNIFLLAKDHVERYGYPAVIFFDEAEALFKVRGSGKSSDVEDTIVTTFLSLADGVEDSPVIILLATNRPDKLDPAVIRDGRIDFKITVTRPTRKSAIDIFRIHMKLSPFEAPVDEMAEYAASELFAPGLVLYEIPVQGEEEPRKMTLGHMADGAMIENIIDRATSITLRRNIASGAREKTTKADVHQAVRDKFAEISGLDHGARDKEALREFVEDFKENVILSGVKKLKQAIE